MAAVAGQRQKIGKQWTVPGPAASASKFAVELAERGFGIVVPGDLRGALEFARDGVERVLGVLRRAKPADEVVELGLDVRRDGGDQSRLPDAGLAGQQHRLTFAVFRSRPATHCDLEFLSASNEPRQTVRVQRLESVRDRTNADRRIDSRRRRDSLEVRNAEVFEFEKLGDEAVRRLGDRHLAGPGDPLKTCRQVRRVPDHPALVRLTGAQEVADHDDASRDADPHLKTAPVRRPQPGNPLGKREPGAHRSLRVVFVGTRIPEIREDGVAHVLRDVAVLELDRFRARLAAASDRLPHFLGIKSRGQSCRTDEVGKHDRQLPPLRERRERRRGKMLLRRSASRRLHMRLDRSEEAMAVADGDDAELLQILNRQPRQDVEIDPVLPESPVVFREAEPAQPVADVHVVSVRKRRTARSATSSRVLRDSAEWKAL